MAIVKFLFRGFRRTRCGRDRCILLRGRLPAALGTVKFPVSIIPAFFLYRFVAAGAICRLLFLNGCLLCRGSRSGRSSLGRSSSRSILRCGGLSSLLRRRRNRRSRCFCLAIRLHFLFFFLLLFCHISPSILYCRSIATIANRYIQVIFPYPARRSLRT